MNIDDAKITVNMNADEAWIIAVALIDSATENTSHWSEHGYDVFVKQNYKSISMAKQLCFAFNRDYVDQKLEEFKSLIDGDEK